MMISERARIKWQIKTALATRLVGRQKADGAGANTRSLNPFKRKAYANTPTSQDESASLVISHDINHLWAVKSISAVSNFTSKFIDDSDGTPLENDISNFRRNKIYGARSLGLIILAIAFYVD